MDSTYLVFFSYEGLATEEIPAIISNRVEAPTFIEVEDWAFENTPVGYCIQAIEKVYGTPSWIDCFGPADVNLRPAA